jgi:hypothetical protein
MQTMIDKSPTFRSSYLLFPEHITDSRQAKTASGVRYWRADDRLERLRLPACVTDLGLQGICATTSSMSVADAEAYPRQTSEKFYLPASDPVRADVGGIVERLPRRR